VTVEINNFETYTSYERTYLGSDGTPWTGGFGTRPVPGYPNSNPANGIADGLGTDYLTLYGTANASDASGWPYGYFQSSLTTLDVGYGVIIPNGSDANGVDINVLSPVPEPSPTCLLAVCGACWLCCQRLCRTFRNLLRTSSRVL
jgi:hypothetical protein